MPQFLADEHFPSPSIRLLREAGYEVVRIAEIAHRSADESVLARSTAEDRVLLTFDRDCGKLVFQRGLPVPSGVVHFRLGACPADKPALRLLDLLERHGATLEGMYTTVKPRHTRQRPLA